MSELILRIDVAASFANVRLLRQAITELCQRSVLGNKTIHNMQLAVSEIATNVIRHGAPKARHISLRVYDKGDKWRVELRDDGGPFIGFSERMSASNPPDYDEMLEGGMGLGLIGAMYPDHAYYSDREGNFFTFYAHDVYSHARLHIAVVDDDTVIRSLLVAYLGSEYETTQYSNGIEALKGIVTSPVDMVISDISMPVLDGFSLRRELSKNVRTSQLPFIFITAEDDQSTQLQATTLGIDDYLVKPICKQQLHTVVKRVTTRIRHIKQLIGDRLEGAITAALKPDLPPLLCGYRVVVGTRSAASGGGDFIHLCHRHDFASVVLGDVMGHGETAKFFAHAYAGYLQGALTALNTLQSPAELLVNLAGAVQGNSVISSTLVTCVALRLGPDAITIASAGHLPPVLVDDDGANDLEISGGLLMLSAGEAYEEKSISLRKGQRLMVYTDGLFEAVGEVKAHGDFRRVVMQILTDTLTVDLEEVATLLLERFDNACDASPRDDATFVLLEVG